MSKDELDSEWLEALEVEDEAVEEPAEEPVEEPVEEVKEDEKESEEPEEVGSDDDSEPAEEPADEAEEPAEDEKVETPEEEPEPEPINETKQAVKEALAEIEASKTDRSTRIDTYKEEVARTLYPEGIDRQLRDADGDPINSIDDLTKLVNPKTEEYFTEEEAGAYMLSKQQELNRGVEQVEKFIEQVAETNAEIEEGANRVVEKYGHVLEKDPELKDRLLKGFDKTLIKDPKTGVTIKAPIEVEDFFSMALDPMLKQQNAEAEAAAKAAAKAEKEAKDRAAKTAQSERGDLKPSGKAEQLDPVDKEWAEAFKSYEEGEVR